MRVRIARAVLGTALAVVATAPMTAPADAWTCVGPVNEVLCFAVGTPCRIVDSATGLGQYCTFG